MFFSISLCGFSPLLFLLYHLSNAIMRHLITNESKNSALLIGLFQTYINIQSKYAKNT